MSRYSFSNNSKRNMEGINPLCIKVLNRAIQITKIDFGVPSDGGVRTAERQHELFLDKKSKCDGYDKKSQHQSGNAFDVYAYVDGKASWDMEHLSMVANAILQAASEIGVPLTWGGLWVNFVDAPHFQLYFRD